MSMFEKIIMGDPPPPSKYVSFPNRRKAVLLTPDKAIYFEVFYKMSIVVEVPVWQKIKMTYVLVSSPFRSPRVQILQLLM